MNLALIGDSGFGKSHLLDHFADCYPDIADETPPRIQVVSIMVTGQSDGRALMRELLSEIGASFRPNDAYDELLRDFCIKAEVAEVGLIVLDEFHNGISERRDRTLRMITAVRDLSNRIRRPIVVAGDERVKELLRYDRQLYERFQIKELPVWTEKNAVMKFLAAFERSLGLPEESRLGTGTMADLVMELAGDHMGSIAELVREAARVAITAGAAKVTDDHLHKAHPLIRRGLPA
ncbi:TniB protein [Lysobacter sp. yr284]|nr:TniB protein [Lysobacter sp. yr284]